MLIFFWEDNLLIKIVADTEVLKLHLLATVPMWATGPVLGELGAGSKCPDWKPMLGTARPACFAEHQDFSWLLLALGKDPWCALVWLLLILSEEIEVYSN